MIENISNIFISHSTLIFVISFIALTIFWIFVYSFKKINFEPLYKSSEKNDFEHALGQLSQNYDVLRRQATQGFILAVAFMSLGILVILAGSVGHMFGLIQRDANIITVAGIIVEVTSVLGLYLFKQTSKRLDMTSDKLHDTWKVLIAFSKAENLPEEKKSKVCATLIKKLVVEKE